MLISDFDFELPPGLIAQEPLANREASRMLVVDRSADRVTDSGFVDLPGYLRRGDVLVLNNTRVFPARLIGTTDTGASVEIFLINSLADGTWLTLARPAKRLRPGKTVSFGPRLSAEIVGRDDDGRVMARFASEGDFYTVLDEVGKTPLPPYIKRGDALEDTDRERYQTVFAKDRGAIAAPTAGLHFTPEILAQVRSLGVTVAEVTLHVGYGTFEPVRVDDLSDHRVAAESYSIDIETASVLTAAKADGRRIVAVGTTTTRALESNLARFGRFTAGSHSADITITPGYSFAAVDALLTNFHLPRSSLLVLTSTFGGHELIMDAYRHAVSNRYRFYSYGDCMFIV